MGRSSYNEVKPLADFIGILLYVFKQIRIKVNTADITELIGNLRKSFGISLNHGNFDIGFLFGTFAEFEV